MSGRLYQLSWGKALFFEDDIFLPKYQRHSGLQNLINTHCNPIFNNHYIFNNTTHQAHQNLYSLFPSTATMKFTLIATFLAATVAAIPNELEGRTGCGSDNCGRAVKAGNLGVAVAAQHVADCNSFLRTTVTPSAVTEYVYKAVPTYASACSGVPRYLTACACVSASAVTVEAPTPTVTQTVTLGGPSVS
ncbi:Fc.00g084700.m01.CDS01 [Cosmosporella sp. VM-42]